LNREKALEIQEKIEKICKENDIWYDLHIKHKPSPEVITFKEITIKVNNGNNLE